MIILYSCSKLTIETPERSGVSMVNFEYISNHVQVFLLLTMNMQLLTGYSTKAKVFFTNTTMTLMV